MKKNEKFQTIEEQKQRQEQMMLQHFTQQAQQRQENITRCQFCQEQVTQTQSQTHQNICKERPVPCEYCGSQFPNSLLPLHVQQCSLKNEHTRLIKRLSSPGPHVTGPQVDRPPRNNFAGDLRQIGKIFQKGLKQVERGGRRIFTSIERLGTQAVVNMQPSVQEPSHDATFRQILESGEQVQQQNQQNQQNRNQRNQPQIPRGDKNIEFKFAPSKNLSPSAKSCPICQGDYERGEDIKMLQCAHRFHKDCLDRWLSRSQLCPICKRNINQ